MNARLRRGGRARAASPGRLQWYVRRLHVMSRAEVAHRLGDLALLQYLRLERRFRFNRRSVAEACSFEFCTAGSAQLPELVVDFDPAAEEVEQLLAADWGALGHPWRWASDDAAWHAAPDTGRYWPTVFFGSIAYRPENPHGDARLVWEPSRLQGLYALALLAQRDRSRASRAAALLQQMLASWIRANPYLCGIHYVSAMECGLRLIALSHALDTARQHLTNATETWTEYVWLVTSHASLIRRRLSRHSSSGNHTIAECAALVYAGLLLPEHQDAHDWLATGLTVLEEEASRQVLPDGGGIEQSLWYHLFVVDLLGLVQLLLRARGHTVPECIAAAVDRGRKFLGAFADTPETLPPIGDADGGYALSRHLRISFSAPGRSARPALEHFPHGGYTILRPNGAADTRVVVDHGPLGMRPSHGHGHADALSVIVSRGDRQVLIDPGTHSYNAGANWRRYFRSSRAHNTVTVDGLDQAEQQGAFLWSSPYDASVAEPLASDGHLSRVLMRHSGYLRIGIIHWRAVVVSDAGRVLVWDRLAGVGEHEFELNWHLGEELVRADPAAGLVQFTGGGFLRVLGGTCALLKGAIDPPSGWRSRTYGTKERSGVLRAVHCGRAPHEFVTLLGPNADSSEFEPMLDELRGVTGCHDIEQKFSASRST